MKYQQVTRLTTGLLFLTFSAFYFIFLIFSTSSADWNILYNFTRTGKLENKVVMGQNFFHGWKDGACHLYFEFGGRVYRNVNGPDNTTVAGIDGQKAVCLDPGLAPPPGMCVVYSFGLSDDWSFDSAMASYGCDVYSFDPSIQHLTMYNNSQRIHYFKIGLGTNNTRKDSRGKRFAIYPL